MTKRALTLIEIIVVLSIMIMILLPMGRLLFSSQKNTVKNMDRQENMDRAKLILEQVRRDLKGLCYSHYSQINFSVPNEWAFPIFPDKQEMLNYKGKQNPVNIVKYVYDSETTELTRTVFLNSLLVTNSESQSKTKVLGKHVTDFSIRYLRLFGQNFFDVHVICNAQSKKAPKIACHLRTCIRSEFEAKLESHKAQIPNKLSTLLIPKISK